MRLTDLISVSEGGRIAGMNRHWIRELAQTGRVDGQQIGAYWFVSRKSLLAYLETERKPGRKAVNKTIP